MIHLPTWLQEHSIEITPQLLFLHGDSPILEADVAVITRACPKRSELLDGGDIYNKSENHKVIMFGMLLDVETIARFCMSAREWLNLPIQELGKTRFVGEYDFGVVTQNRFVLEFREYAQTPSKTDWMRLEVRYVNGEDFGEKAMHIDFTCLNEFVAGWELWSDQHNNVLRNWDQ